MGGGSRRENYEDLRLRTIGRVGTGARRCCRAGILAQDYLGNS